MSGPMVQDIPYAKVLAEQLVPVLAGRDFPELTPGAAGGNGAGVNVAETFEEAGMTSLNGGVVLYMSDGTEVHLTIQAYVPRGDR